MSAIMARLSPCGRSFRVLVLVFHACAFGVAAAAPADDGPVARPPARERRATDTTELRGVWVSDVDSEVMHSRDTMAALAEQVASLNLNALYPVVWSQGETFYPSDRWPTGWRSATGTASTSCPGSSGV
jgi:uncharacterized lipoprotein YddW (UPF0748 family)